MVALTFVTGVVDAVGFLGLDRVFTGNMTGNIVILGMGVAGADDLPVLGPAIALAGFTAAAWVAGLVLRGMPPGWQVRITTLLGIGGLVLAGLAIAALADPLPGAQGQIVFATATAAVMGQQAMVARALAVRDMTTVVVTSTLAGLAGETWVQGYPGALFNRRLVAIVVIFLGAVAGALLLKVHLAVPLALASAVTFAVVLVGHRTLREPAKPARARPLNVR
ncbi:Uncharacterised protein [Mycolicibacterium vanbaalenii]|uniref:DUF1275 domain-containing protein n=1 Tax=Mycolicibacterium vanbaalenii TaxID=110539 RepID=A0A5S9QFK4_MYCVN|nr:YoaK family protein [Mycolicibacterium vanbaalenii]CAA0117333.1 Uncharacterised protein [Mycolicibacterium vanbaalenii]